MAKAVDKKYAHGGWVKENFNKISTLNNWEVKQNYGFIVSLIFII